LSADIDRAGYMQAPPPVARTTTPERMMSKASEEDRKLGVELASEKEPEEADVKSEPGLQRSP
jgi:hypothetical protein